ncbi:MAG: cob(I)yrinic acid a,c-diamide adenosyltransferase, partial [Thermoleophilia bacterium]|nr:cob(I)yrinic acid a,c-diamide adenosyltransferase [Thermoleophilia bacterium]
MCNTAHEAAPDAASNGNANPDNSRASCSPPRALHKTPSSLVLLNTGDGKGKSTAAFGVIVRALAQGWRVCVIQFLKSAGWQVGEEVVFRRLGVEWLKGGDGFTWKAANLCHSR